jgi:hypothetical protein
MMTVRETLDGIKEAFNNGKTVAHIQYVAGLEHGIKDNGWTITASCDSTGFIAVRPN